MPIKKPGAFVHPKRKRASDQPPKQITEVADILPPQDVQPHAREASQSKEPKTEQFRLVVYPPVEGQIPLYDEMIKSGIPSNRVLLGLVNKGFERFEKDLLTGNIKVDQKDLRTQGKPVDTTRNVTPRFVKLAREAFDPFGIMSERALGRSICEFILRREQK